MTQSQWVFAAVLITSFIGPFMGSSINIAIPAMANDFSLPAEHLSWIVTIFLLGSVAVLVPFGKLADVIGRKTLYRMGLLALLAATIACGLAVSVEMLIVFRLLQGISLGMIFSTGMAMLVSASQPQHRGRVIGYSAAATYIGLSLGPVLGGALTQFFGWRMIFFLTAAGLVLSLLAIAKVKGEWYGSAGDRLDFIGSIIYCAASVLLIYGLSACADHGMARYMLAAGGVLLVGFVFQQKRTAHPLIALPLFKNTVFAMSNFAAMLHYSSTFALNFLLSLYLQLIRGLDAATAGLVLLQQPLMMALLSPLAGSLSDKFQPRLVASTGMAMTALGLAAFSGLTPESSLLAISGNLLFIGIGFAFFSSPNSNAIMGAVEAKNYGVAAAILSVMRLSGQAVSMALVTVLLAVYTVDALSPDYLSSLMRAFHEIFLVLAVSCSCGVVISLARGKL